MFSIVPLKYCSVIVTVAVYEPFSGVMHVEGPADTDSVCAEASAGNASTSVKAATRPPIRHLLTIRTHSLRSWTCRDNAQSPRKFACPRAPAAEPWAAA